MDVRGMTSVDRSDMYELWYKLPVIMNLDHGSYGSPVSVK